MDRIPHHALPHFCQARWQVSSQRGEAGDIAGPGHPFQQHLLILQRILAVLGRLGRGQHPVAGLTAGALDLQQAAQGKVHHGGRDVTENDPAGRDQPKMAGPHTTRRHRQFHRIHTHDNEAARYAVHLRLSLATAT